jgi:hypothetical protein
MFVHNEPSPLIQDKNKKAKGKSDKDKRELQISFSVKGSLRP